MKKIYHLTSAVANMSFPQVHGTPDMVLVYTIPNKIHANLAIQN